VESLPFSKNTDIIRKKVTEPYSMNKKQQRVLNAIQTSPPPADLKWDDVESLFRALGAIVSQGSGSRVRISLNGVKATFHKPHPHNEVGKSCVKDIRLFLENANII
jgi:hypothetical protein